MPKPIPMPFYLAANAPGRWANETDILEDADYLKSIAPQEISHYRKEVSNILDKLDFDNHSIYDEYPDKMKLENLSNQILRQIQYNEERVNPRNPLQPQKWQWLNYLIYQLLLEEIFYRRHHHGKPFRPIKPMPHVPVNRPGTRPPQIPKPPEYPRGRMQNNEPYPMPSGGHGRGRG